MTFLFLASFLSAAGSAWGLYLWGERRQTAFTLRRLNAPKPADAMPRRSAGPRLIDSADEVRGRLAAGLLDRLHLKAQAERLLERAALKWGAEGLLHRSAALFLVAFGAMTLATGNGMPPAALAVGFVAALFPLTYTRRAAATRLRKFEEQFPEALEFVSRSMRAGHAFSVALDLVHREFPDPLAAEFRRAFEEQNLGQPIDIVLRKLTERVPSMDVRFFAAAVVLQKRTGGNLAELLDKLAYIIRERFKLRARIRAVSAQGLMSGRILASIPPAVALLMFVVNPNYARFFVADPMGHRLLAAGLGLQVLGYSIIRKIVSIEV
jgi:tight adherence protein B